MHYLFYLDFNINAMKFYKLYKKAIALNKALKKLKALKKFTKSMHLTYIYVIY